MGGSGSSKISPETESACTSSANRPTAARRQAAMAVLFLELFLKAIKIKMHPFPAGKGRSIKKVPPRR